MSKRISGFPLLLAYLGLFLVFEGLVMLIPLLSLIFYPSEWQGVYDFLIPQGSAIVLGLLLYFSFGFKREKGRIGKNEDALLLVLIWVFATLLGALPFFLTQFREINFGNAEMSLGMNFAESIFESISGLATDGLSTFPEKAYLTFDPETNMAVDACFTYPASHLFLFHRAWLQFIGGIGLVLLVTSLISSKNNFRLYFAEGHNDKIVPNLARSAKILFLLYFGLVSVGAFALWLAGLSVFDAICHSIAAVATGGYSTRYTNMYFYAEHPAWNGLYSPSSPLAIEGIACVLMLLGATNFLLTAALIRGRFKEFFKDIEIRTMLWLLVLFTLLISLSSIYLYDANLDGIAEGMDPGTSFRYGFFLAVSSLTTTGLANFPNVKMMGQVALFGTFALQLVGGGIGSTAGGLKQFRFALLWKEFTWSLHFKNDSRNTLRSRSIYRLGEEKEVDPSTVAEANHYALLMLIVCFLGGCSLMLLPGISFTDGLIEFLMGFSSTGITVLDLVSYRASYPMAYYNTACWIVSLAMFLGRLEILPLYYAIRRVSLDPLERALEKRKRSKRNVEA